MGLKIIAHKQKLVRERATRKESNKLTFAFRAVNDTLAGGFIFDLTVWALALSRLWIGSGARQAAVFRSIRVRWVDRD